MKPTHFYFDTDESKGIVRAHFGKLGKHAVMDYSNDRELILVHPVTGSPIQYFAEVDSSLVQKIKHHPVEDVKNRIRKMAQKIPKLRFADEVEKPGVMLGSERHCFTEMSYGDILYAGFGGDISGAYASDVSNAVVMSAFDPDMQDLYIGITHQFDALNDSGKARKDISDFVRHVEARSINPWEMEFTVACQTSREYASEAKRAIDGAAGKIYELGVEPDIQFDVPMNFVAFCAENGSFYRE